jgi:predicted nuclease with TOPRIM domain
MDIAVVDIVVHNTVVAEVEETAQIAEAVEVHIEEAKVHIAELEERIAELEELAERIVVLQVHIEELEERIAELAERIAELEERIAERIVVLQVHIADTVGTVDNKDIADMTDRNVVILERYSLLGESLLGE